MPILLKLYRCFCHDLKICMWFGYYPEIIFCHFFCNLNLVIFKCTIMAGDINSLNLLVKNRSRSTVFEIYLLDFKKPIINICKLLSRNNKFI